MATEMHTYEEWGKLGYHIIKGSKSREFRDNKAYFSEEQVAPFKNTSKPPKASAMRDVLTSIGTLDDYIGKD